MSAADEIAKLLSEAQALEPRTPWGPSALTPQERKQESWRRDLATSEALTKSLANMNAANTARKDRQQLIDALSGRAALDKSPSENLTEYQKQTRDALARSLGAK